MGLVSMPRLAISLFFVNYSLLSLVTYMSSTSGKLPIFWTLVQAIVWMLIELVFIGLWNNDAKATSK